MKYVGQTGGHGSLLLPPMCDEHNQTADFFCLCWTFRLSTVKEINLFLPACVSSIFFSSCPLSSLPLCDPVSPFLVFLLTIPCPVSPFSPPPSPRSRPSAPSLYTKGRFRGHQLPREGWESCMGSALRAAILYYRHRGCRYAAATGCRHNSHSFSPGTGAV